ncbi:MAG: DUF2304 family protein [Patescibacteria group bacterium]|nr:DUF2304 family protein [Patescibacteria group bacterium]
MYLQVVIAVFVLFALSRIYLRFKEGELSVSGFIFWLIVWLLIGVVGFWPGTTQNVADFLGIERGIDSVVYFSIVVIFYLIYKIFVRIEHLERDITKVVRDNALDELDND